MIASAPTPNPQSPTPLVRLMADAFTFRKPEPAVEWLPKNIHMPAGLETRGAFDLDWFPHVRGVVEAWDDPEVRWIILMWGTRLAKTMTSLSLIVHGVTQFHRPGIIGSSNKDTLADMVDGKLYPLLEACHATRTLVPPEGHRKIEKGVLLGTDRIRCGWSGSPSSLAANPACYVLANEVSKWSDKKSAEAPPEQLIIERAKNYPFDAKILFESSPALKGRCKVTKLASAEGVRRHRFVVPCPHCGEYQPLVFGQRGGGPGLKWEYGADGKRDIQRARETAYYQCANECRIESHERIPMVRRGVWLPEGQSIDTEGVISGRPSAPREKCAFIGLGYQYSPLLKSWGQLASDWLTACSQGQETRRNFINSTLAECYDPAPRATTPDDLRDALRGTHATGTVPLWGKFLTCAIDVQIDGELFACMVCAWGDGGRGAIIEHGYHDSWQEIVEQVLMKSYPHADGGPPLRVLLGLMDSGFKEQMVYDLCRRFKNLLPCKGNPMKDQEYKQVTVDPDKQKNKHAHLATQLVHVSSDFTQGWINRIVGGELLPDEPPFEIPFDIAPADDLCEQLLNEQRLEERDKEGQIVVKWVRIEHHKPNDFRDCCRYNKVAASMVTKGGTLWDRLPARVIQPRTVSETRQPAGGATTPDGRSFLVNQRS